MQPSISPGYGERMRQWVVLAMIMAAGCAPGSGNEVLSFDEVASGCAAIRSCTNMLSTFRSCVGRPETRPLPPEFACLARVRGDCNAALDCLGLTVTLGASCVAASLVCDGDAVVGCDPGLPGMESSSFRFDCAARGLVCIERTTGGPVCGRPCTETCVGNDLVRCTDRGDVYVCPAGTSCDGTDCAPTGPVCTDWRCEGDDLIECSGFPGAEGREFPPFSCASWGAHCGYEGGSARCIPDGDTCDPSTVAARCEGESIVFCGEDRGMHSFDCTGHGYLGCSGGSSALLRAPGALAAEPVMS